MELHELEVGHLRARLERHGHAVAGRDGGIRGLGEHLPGTAGGEQRRAGPDHVPRIVRVTIRRADAVPALAEQFGDDRVIDDRDGRQRRHLPMQHAADLAPGGVLRVQHAPDAVGRLARRRRPAIRVAIEARTPVQQLGDVGGTFLDERAHRVRLAEAVTGGERVLEVQARRIVVAHGHGNAALRPPRAALFRFALREDADPPPVRQRQRRAERSNAAAEYQEIGVRGHQTLLSYHPLRAGFPRALSRS